MDKFKYTLKRWWKTFISYIGWEDYLGLFLLVVGLVGYIPYFSGLSEFYTDMRSELISIGIVVLIIDNANEAIKRREEMRQEKKRLIVQMGSPNNAFAVEAVRQLRARGWLFDGSLSGAELWGANLEGAELDKADLTGAYLDEANLRKATLDRANLEGGVLEGADLRRASLLFVDLRGCNLQRVNLEKVDLSFSDLSDAILDESNLKGAWLAATNLWDTEFVNADLRNAYFDGTVPGEYKAREADLEGVILMGANLEGAHLDDGQLAKAKSLEGATMPDGTKYYDGWFDKEEGEERFT